MHSTVVLSWLG